MIRDPAAARDSMAALFAEFWQSQDWAALGFAGMPHIEWQGRGASFDASADAPYAIWQAMHSAAPQRGLSDATGQKSYETIGLISVQSKGPLINGNGFEVAERMAIIARNAYRGKQTPDCIWFRNARVEEVGADAGWYLFNTIIEFEYDEVA